MTPPPRRGAKDTQPASEPVEPVQPAQEPAGEPIPEPVQPEPVVGVPTPEPLTAPQALIEVMKRVQPIEKERQADQKAGGYKFRGIDDAYNALHDVMADVGLVVMPSVLERLREQRTTAGGGTNHVTSLHVQFTFIARDGSRETCTAWGEGGDTGDKSTQKAHSQALKTALLEVFLIPTQASAVDDPDASNVEPGRAYTAEEQQRATNALGAAVEATTVETLAGVRQRALALLPVPVMHEGSVAPLSWHIDQRRMVIERNSQEQPA